jgi:neutral ceramidase
MLHLGVAVRDITPTRSVWMDGYGDRDRPSAGVYAPLTARVLALRQGNTAALITVADVLNFDREQERQFKASIGAATGLPAEAVILCATHTHCGPRCADILMLGERDGEFLTRLEAQLAAAAQQALAEAGPAEAAFSRTRSAFGINRRLPDGAGGVRFHPNPEGVIDRDLDTYWFTTAEGTPIASLTLYGCHPTSRAGYDLGPDYPGTLRQRLERDWGGQALFLTGCAGNIRPAFLDERGLFRSAQIEEVEAAGEALAAEALAGRFRARRLTEPCLRVTSGTAMLPVEEAPDRAALERMAQAEGTDFASRVDREWSRRMLQRLEAGPLPRAVPFTVQTLSLDRQHALVFLAGEVVTEIGLAIKQAHPYHVLSTPAYSNGIVGYVPSRSIYPQGGYEVRGAYKFYLQPGAFTSEVEEVILAEVARQLAG